MPAPPASGLKGWPLSSMTTLPPPRRGAHPEPEPGHWRLNRPAMVIRALIRARLLGLQLLTLEARVVVDTDGGRLAAATSSPRVLVSSGRVLEPSGVEPSPELGSGYARP